jgi:hypothetical protein
MGEAHGDVPPCEIRVDAEGKWFYRGAEIIRQDIVKLFMENLELDDQGRYIISWRGQRCYIEVEDTPFVVWQTVCVEKDGQPERLILKLNDGSEEVLEPSSLIIGANNVPYCLVRGGRFRARFSRRAYYQLARLIQEDPHTGGFFFQLGGRRWEVRLEPRLT